MSLVLGTIVWVIAVTAVLGLVVYAVDRGTARQERKE
jgi:preprotein translocase subunit SecE